MQYYRLEDLYEELEEYKKEAEKLRTGIAVYSEILEENLDYKEKAKSLRRFINRFEKELSVTLFKCAIIEGIIKRDECLRGIQPKD